MAGRGFVCLFGWNIENVQDASSGWFGGGRLARVMGYVVTVDNVVIPVSLARLEGRALEAERPFPGTRFRRRLVFRKRKLTGVVVPRAEKMDGLDAGGCAQSERELNGGHCSCHLMHLSGVLFFGEISLMSKKS
jgi:hypothetical protein